MTSVDFYSKGQIDDLDIGKPADAASSTGSLWARVKNALSRIGSAETNITNLQTGKADDNAVVKLTGNQTVAGVKTFSSSPSVPTTPAEGSSAVNSAYVNDGTGTYSNNIVHKSNTEIINGSKYFTSGIYRSVSFDLTEPPASAVVIVLFQWNNNDANSTRLGNIFLRQNPAGDMELWTELRKNDGTYAYTKLAGTT